MNVFKNVVFPCCAKWETIVADTKSVSEQNQKRFLCPGHKICVRNKCCARAKGEIFVSATMCPCLPGT